MYWYMYAHLKNHRQVPSDWLVMMGDYAGGHSEYRRMRTCATEIVFFFLPF